MDDLGGFDLASLQVLVVLQGVEAGGVVVVRGALRLCEACVLRTHALLVRHHVVEVQVGEDTVVRHRVVRGGRLVVVQVRETGAVGSAQVERHVLVSVVDGVALLALEELEDVVLHDGVLLDSTGVGAGGLARDAVTDGEDILVLVVLESVAVNVDHTSGVADTRIEQELVLTGRWVDVCADEVSFDGLTGVNVLEDGDLGVSLLTDAEELPAEVDLNATLGALLKSDLVGVGEAVDEFVGRPVLDLGSSGGGSEELVLTHEGLVVERVEVSSLTLVGGSGRVVDVVTSTEHPVVVEVAHEAVFVVELVNEHVVFLVALIEFREAIDELAGVVETGTEDESLVAELLAVSEGKLVGAWVKLGDLSDFDLGPVLDHGGESTSLHLQRLDVTLENTEVSLGLDPDGVLGDHSDLQVSSSLVLLKEFSESTTVGATYSQIVSREVRVSKR